jgi:hypothetical protein
MDRTKQAVAKRLAESHFLVEPQIARIYRLLAPDDREALETEPIKLLEVNPATPKNGIMPIYFGPHTPSGIFYPSIIVELHPDEFVDLESGNLALPDGWRLGNHYSRPSQAVSA